MWVILDEWLISDGRVPLLERGAVLPIALELRTARPRDVGADADGQRAVPPAVAQTAMPDAPAGCVTTTLSGRYRAERGPAVKCGDFEVLLPEPLDIAEGQVELVGELAVAVFAGAQHRRQWCVQRIIRQVAVVNVPDTPNRPVSNGPSSSSPSAPSRRLVSRRDYVAAKTRVAPSFAPVEWGSVDGCEVLRIEAPGPGHKPGTTRYLLDVELVGVGAHAGP
jgi:hypothetical protein